MSADRRLRAVVIALACAGVIGACHSYSSSDGSGDVADGGSPDAVSPGQTTDGGSSGSSDAGDNGSVDAAPPEGCPSAGRSCVPDAPDGWTGPLFVYDGDDSAVPHCPSTMALARINAHRGFHDPTTAGSCSDCDCTNAIGQTCGGSINVGDATCGGATSKTLMPGQCASAPGGAGYTITETVSGGQCNPIGGIPQGGDATWDSATRACGAPSLLRTGCSDGEVCAPTPDNPFRSKLCVSKTGDVDCPTGSPYNVKLLTNGEDDERKCLPACACNAPTGGTCTTSFAFGYPGSTNCSGVFSMVTLPITSCTVAPNGGFSLMANIGGGAQGGSCTPVNQTPTFSGTVTANDPVTVCCQN